MNTNITATVKSETFKQKVLRNLYPLIRKMGKKGKNGTILINKDAALPAVSFYELSAEQNNNQSIDFGTFKGKKVLLVNTASNCGYTGQYAELQSLHQKYDESLNIIAFPANDFAEQEKKNDNEIAEFCQLNYGVTFPVMKKTTVVKKSGQDEVFKWLTNKNLNGWNEHEPDWNFSKYLVNEKGILTHYFGPSISPLEEDFLKAIK